MKLFYSDDYVLAAHAFDTTRKAGWIAESLCNTPVAGVELVAPKPLTAEQLATIHSPEYVNAVRTGEPRGLAESQGFSWDPGLWRMVCATNGGAVAAALAAMKDGVAGSLSSGLHHARRDRGAGFCTFNGLALAAKAALTAGSRGVLILDLDAHCGGGTASLIRGEPRIAQIDVAVSPVDKYDSDEQCRLKVMRGTNDYTKWTMAHAEYQLYELKAQGLTPDLMLYNGGMDPYEGCDVGGMRGVTFDVLANRERQVFGWARDHSLHVAFVLAGGYIGPDLDKDTLVALHRLTIAEAARR